MRCMRLSLRPRNTMDLMDLLAILKEEANARDYPNLSCFLHSCSIYPSSC